MKQGQFLSERTYYTIKSVQGDRVIATTSTGDDVELSVDYINTFCSNASVFITTKKVNQTELLKIIASNSSTAMTIEYQKVDVAKSGKTYRTELADRAEVLKNDFLLRGVVALEEALKNPVLNYTPGALRTIVGYPTGVINDNGLLAFIDAEDKFTLKQVNPRTIKYVMVDGMKYVKK